MKWVLVLVILTDILLFSLFLNVTKLISETLLNQLVALRVYMGNSVIMKLTFRDIFRVIDTNFIFYFEDE